jgi:hypothetical protein
MEKHELLTLAPSNIASAAAAAAQVQPGNKA